MATFLWDQDTNIVSADDSSLNAIDYQAVRGQRDIRLLIRQGGVETLLAVDQTVGLIVRDPANFDEGYLAGPSLLTRPAAAADGYFGLTSTDTTFTRDVMHVDDASTPELASYPASAVFFYAPTEGGQPIESLPFDWTILRAYYRTGQPPADIVATWPSAAQLTAVVEAAGSKEPGLGAPAANGYFLTGNTDKSRAWVAFPMSVNGTFTATTFAGSGANLTNLPATALTGAVAVANGGTGATAPAAARANLGAAPVAGPTFTGIVTIPTGAIIAGYAPLASPTFAGTVTIPPGAAIAGYAKLADISGLAPLASPTFTGTVTIPGGANIVGYAPLADPAFSGNVTFAQAVNLPNGSTVPGYAPLAGPTFTGTTYADTFRANQIYGGLLSSDGVGIITGDGEYTGPQVACTGPVSGTYFTAYSLRCTAGAGFWGAPGPDSLPDLGAQPQLGAIYSLLQQYGMCAPYQAGLGD